MADENEHSAPEGEGHDLYRRLAEAYSRSVPPRATTQGQTAEADYARRLRGLHDEALGTERAKCQASIERFRQLRGQTDLVRSADGPRSQIPQSLLVQRQAIDRELQRRELAHVLHESVATFEPSAPLLIDLVQDPATIATVEWTLKNLLDSRSDWLRNLRTLLQEARDEDLAALLYQIMEASFFARGADLPRLLNELFGLVNGERMYRNPAADRLGTPEYRQGQVESARTLLADELGLLLPETSSLTPRIDPAGALEPLLTSPPSRDDAAVVDLVDEQRATGKSGNTGREQRRRVADGSRTKNDPEWRARMRRTDIAIDKHSGQSRTMAFAELQYPPVTSRTLRNYERWWRELKRENPALAAI